MANILDQFTCGECCETFHQLEVFIEHKMSCASRKIKNPDASQWLAFFTKAGLPPATAVKNSIIFSDNRMQLDMLSDISEEYLYAMGIEEKDDVEKIMSSAKEFNTQNFNGKSDIFNESGSQANSCNTSARNNSSENFLAAFQDQDTTYKSNYAFLSNVSTALTYSTCASNISNYNSDVNSAVKFKNNNDQVQQFDSEHRYLSHPLVDMKQNLPSVISSNNNCAITGDATNVSYPLRYQESESDSSNLAVTGSTTEICAATSVEINKQDILMNDINMNFQMYPGYYSHIESNVQKGLSQNVPPDTDSDSDSDIYVVYDSRNEHSYSQ